MSTICTDVHPVLYPDEIEVFNTWSYCISPLLMYPTLPQSAAPQSTPVTSQDPSSIVAVQLRVPDTNTPANSKTQQRSSNSNPLSSEYSLFELETFFTRWAPDNDSVSTPGGPSCSFTTDDSAECDQDGVIVVEAEPQPQHVLQPPQGSASSSVKMSGGQSFSSAPERSRVHIQPSVSQGKRSPFLINSRFNTMLFDLVCALTCLSCQMML